MNAYGIGMIVVTAMWIFVAVTGAGVFYYMDHQNKKKRMKNQGIAEEMLRGIIAHQLNGLLKTARKGNNINAPMKHLCSSLCIFFALMDDEKLAVLKVNPNFRDLIKANSDPSIQAMNVWIQVRDEDFLPRHLLVRIGYGGGTPRYYQDVGKLFNWDKLSG